ncbi:hypothetical protein EPA93_22570 [Ktedonosporobacter rubrisoli]|uniref:Uncharacterized protein n=1 Tax=Ktedonosporobacter rubrisoli TaxID=2509675 RepID=A0A4P6JTH6_KTERU|nr:hypothetical protein [Ktedonosporobacter rubrisoli]QBD78625.1 hypothetical protein EPA93_22570 [Ktedonosporobacter rubrisoli]
MPELFMLSLLWLGIGLVVGALSNTAGLRLPAWGAHGWLLMLILGALTALFAGWLAIVCLGRIFATLVALWVSVPVVAFCPRWLTRAYLLWRSRYNMEHSSAKLL